MKYALVDENGIVQNIIDYDGAAPYTPSVGLTIVQVQDWIDIGAAHDAAQPVPVEIVPEPITPDLSTQLAALLIAKGTIAASDLHPDTLADVNAQLTDAGEATIAVPADEVKS